MRGGTFVWATALLAALSLLCGEGFPMPVMAGEI